MARKTYRKPPKQVRENNAFAIDADIPKREVDTPPSDSGHITESASLDSYLDIAEKENSLQEFEKDAEIDELKRQLEESVVERDILRSRVEKLEATSKKQDETLHSGISNQELERRIETLETENTKLHEMVLRLEGENGRLKTSLGGAQAAVDGMLHSYTKPGYHVGSGVKVLKDGYQDWV